MCNECELEYGNSEDDMFAYCPCCGRRFFYDDGVYVDGAEESVCPSCARTETIECENCGELFYSNTIVFDRKTERHLCQCCYEDLTDLVEGE
jgi:formylmethanofuran dehydrogenase subunit E